MNKHVKILARGSRHVAAELGGVIAAILAAVAAIGVFAAPLIIAASTEDASWFWLYLIHFFVVAYLAGED